jgi:hypothetical protein
MAAIKRIRTVAFFGLFIALSIGSHSQEIDNSRAGLEFSMGTCLNQNKNVFKSITGNRPSFENKTAFDVRLFFRKEKAQYGFSINYFSYSMNYDSLSFNSQLLSPSFFFEYNILLKPEKFSLGFGSLVGIYAEFNKLEFLFDVNNTTSSFLFYRNNSANQYSYKTKANPLISFYMDFKYETVKNRNLFLRCNYVFNPAEIKNEFEENRGFANGFTVMGGFSFYLFR